MVKGDPRAPHRYQTRANTAKQDIVLRNGSVRVDDPKYTSLSDANPNIQLYNTEDLSS